MSENVRVVAITGTKTLSVPWERVVVQRQLGTCAGTFQVEIASRDEGLLRNGQRVNIVAGDRTVMVGFVETSEFELERGAPKFSFSGREITCDLVDCTAPTLDINLFKQMSLRALAYKLAAEHGLQVIVNVPEPSTDARTLRPFTEFAVKPDESCWSALERAARLRKVMVQGDGQGRVEIIDVGTVRAAAALRAGVNVNSARFTSTIEQRFRLYRIVGQKPSDGTRGWREDQALALAEVEDLAIDRPRRLVIVAENAVDHGTAAERAEWEATVRAARSTTLQTKVDGWRQDFNPAALDSPIDRFAPFWRPNLIVPVHLPQIGITEELLTDTVRLEVARGDSAGSKASLDLVRKDSYRLLTEKADVAEHAADALEDDE